MTLRLASNTIMAGIALFIIVGVLGIVAPAFHYLPVLGANRVSIQPWMDLFLAPEFVSSLQLTLFSGILATLASLLIAFSVVAAFYNSWGLSLVKKSLAPILAIPHAAMAIGLLFLFSPSGWLIRLFTSFDRPPNWITVQDPYALSLIFALIVKETPYLIFIILACLTQIKADDTLKIGLSMGYSRSTVWQKILFPMIYPLIRLPVFVVLAFSLTVVDLALIIGPNTPSTFAVTLFRWFKESDLNERFVASAGAVFLLFLVLIVFMLWEACYQLFTLYSKKKTTSGTRQTYAKKLFKLIGSLYFFLLLNVALSLLILFIWSFAKRWRFPNTLPSSWSLSNLDRHISLVYDLSANTLFIGIVSNLLALIISVVLLESKRINVGRKTLFDRLIYLPILLPQVGFLFGIQIFLIKSGFSGDYISVILLHLFYTLPYVYLTLHGPYLDYNQDYFIQACALKRSTCKAFIQIKLPMLASPILSAFAIGFSVSVAQYLPTLIAGNGLINTLTTEAVTIASSGERKLVSLLALIQAFFPLSVFILAIWLPKVWTPFRLKIAFYRLKTLNNDTN
jgi:putative thiamine transport system permease protein